MRRWLIAGPTHKDRLPSQRLQLELGLAYIQQTQVYWRAANCSVPFLKRLPNNTDTKRVPISDGLTSRGSVLATITTDYMRPNILATSAPLYWLSSPVSSLYIGTSDIISLKYWISLNYRAYTVNNRGHSSLTGCFSVLNKTVVSNSRRGCFVMQWGQVVQTVIRDSFLCKSHRLVNAAKTPHVLLNQDPRKFE